MAHYHGKDGGVNIGAALAGIGSWEINATGEVADTTGMDSSGARELVAGITGWGGSFEATWDSTDTPFTSLAAGTSFTGTFYCHSASTINFVGDCIVTGFRMRTDITDKISYAVDFEGTGALSATGL